MTHAEIKSLREQITPPPWLTKFSAIYDEHGGSIVSAIMEGSNLDFIAAAPAIIDQLLNEREALLDEIKQLKDKSK